MSCCFKAKKKKRGNEIEVSSHWKKGLKNVGNSCYMNSVLHCLFSINVIKDFLSSPPLSGKAPVLQALSRLYIQLLANKGFPEYRENLLRVKQVGPR